MAITPVRSSVFQRAQLGLEAADSPGTAVAATIRLPTMMFALDPAWEVKEYRGQGFKYPGVTVANKFWSTAKYEGPGSYTEMGVILASIFSNPGGFTGTFLHSVDQPDIPATYTIEYGDPRSGYQATSILAHDMTLLFDRSETKISGSCIGMGYKTGVALTTGIKALDIVPIVANEVDVFLDTSAGGIGTTKLPRGYVAELALSGRWGPNWVLDSAQPSWESYVELVPKATFKLTMESNPTSDAIVGYISASKRIYLRIAAKSPSGHSFTLDAATMGTGTGGMKDLAGVWVAEWNLIPIADTATDGLGFALQATLN